MKHVCQFWARYWPGHPMTLSSEMNDLLYLTTWLVVARMPMGSHKEESIWTDGSERSQASSSSDSGLPLMCLAPPGPSVLTSKMAQLAPPALVANALLPFTR